MCKYILISGIPVNFYIYVHIYPGEHVESFLHPKSFPHASSPSTPNPEVTTVHISINREEFSLLVNLMQIKSCSIHFSVWLLPLNIRSWSKSILLYRSVICTLLLCSSLLYMCVCMCTQTYKYVCTHVHVPRRFNLFLHSPVDKFLGYF